MAITPVLKPKRVQRGLITFASGDLQASKTISAIDMSRSEIRHLGSEPGTARIWLKNFSTLWAVRDATGTVQDVAWEIKEW